MAIHIRDSETDRLARELARAKGVGLTEAVRTALRHELERERKRVPLAERVRDIQEIVAGAGRTGLRADKAWFDEMWGEPELSRAGSSGRTGRRAEAKDADAKLVPPAAERRYANGIPVYTLAELVTRM